MRGSAPMLLVWLAACSAASKGSGEAAAPASTTDTAVTTTPSTAGPSDSGVPSTVDTGTGGLPTTPTTPAPTGCGDTAPELLSLEAEGVYDGIDVGVHFFGELSDADGGLHEATALLWYDLDDDGVVDTSGDPALRIAIDTDALPCEAPELSATVRVGLDFGYGGPFEASLRFEDADGHLSEPRIAAACVPEADGTLCSL